MPSGEPPPQVTVRQGPPPGPINNLTAWCRQCGMPWSPPVAIGGDGLFQDMEVSPCPGCGGTGVVPNGYLKMMHFAAQTFRSLDRDRLTDLREVLEGARSTTDDAAAVAEQLERASPELAPAARWLATQNNRMEVGMWISALLALISVLIAMRGADTVSPEQVQRIVHDVVEQTNREAINPGRNSPCLCGSGRKWKHCHGAPSSAVSPSTPAGRP